MAYRFIIRVSQTRINNITFSKGLNINGSAATIGAKKVLSKAIWYRREFPLFQASFTLHVRGVTYFSVYLQNKVVISSE